MEMDRKKRPACLEEEQGQDEEEKIEMFFAIIRRFHDACGQSMNSLHEPKETTNAQQVRKKPKIQHESVWTPSFEWEDFAGLELKNACITYSSITTNEPVKKEKEKNQEWKGLDLNLPCNS
ncbi:hypothetical protein VitviT2T_020794 [Vitis vinifera]|uniref:Uncharacterized protein n=1 Tax=Vitis vinifera TaxID=29760 RepID=A0ABY9D524_VITVI|nr:hypothetical protein VitviT2T_020794 [Vitis vinifera]